MRFVSRFKRTFATCLTLAGLTIATSASALPTSASLVIDTSSGLLLGARNVMVQGFAYDVDFVNGTCADIFSGCDHPLDFAFSDLLSVRAAGHALLDQVFLDVDGYSFDSYAGATAGCGGGGPPVATTSCYVHTPFTRMGFAADGTPARLILYDLTMNAGSEHIDMDWVIGAGPGGQALDPWYGNSATTWARWTQPTSVPEPSTLALFAGAIVVVLFTRRLRRGRPLVSEETQRLAAGL